MKGWSYKRVSSLERGNLVVITISMHLISGLTKEVSIGGSGIKEESY
jgi:hypothetical protein